MVRARNILTAANLLTPELESLYKAAEAAIFVIAGKPVDPWAPAIIAIIAFGLNEYKRIANQIQKYKGHLKQAKEYAEEFDRLAIELVYLPEEVW